MDDVTKKSLREEAEKLRKSKDFTAALVVYEQLITHPATAADKWISWGYAQCLYKLKRYQEALAQCRTGYQLDATFQLNNDLYAWCVYFLVISDKNQVGSDRWYQAARAIVQLCSPNLQYNPLIISIFEVVNHLKQKTPYPAQAVLKWLSHLNPTDLSDQPSSFKTQEGKTIEVASQLETYYAHLAKAALKSKQYQLCIDTAQTALDRFSKLHYNNHIWLRRLMAIAYEKLGNTTAALEHYQQLVKIKQDWFLHKEIAQLYENQGDTARALRHAVTGLLTSGDLDKKIGLLDLSQRLVAQDGKKEHFRTLAAVNYGLRKFLERPIPPVFLNAMTEEQIEPLRFKHLGAYAKEVRKWALGLADEFNPMITGTIKTILPNNVAGFIQADTDKKTYYFEKRAFRQATEIKVGMKVQFRLKDSFDRKKNKPSKAATDIRVSPSSTTP